MRPVFSATYKDGSLARIAIASGSWTVAIRCSDTRTAFGASDTDGAGWSPPDVHAAIATSASAATRRPTARHRALTRPMLRSDRSVRGTPCTTALERDEAAHADHEDDERGELPRRHPTLGR